MEIRNLTTFVKVAQLNSFSKAAKELGYSQAAVTIQIQHLENELQTRLFERFNKSIRLSEEGELFFIHALEILQAVESAKTSMKHHKEPEGILRIGTIESLCTSIFPDLIQTYHSAYPNVHIELESASPAHLLELLKQNKVDLVYLLDQPLCDASFTKVMEEKEEVVFVCSSNHPLANRILESIDVLCEQQWLLTEENASYRCELTKFLALQDRFLAPTLSVGNTDLIINLVKRGMGISFLPKSVVQPYIDTNKIASFQVSQGSFDIYRQLLYHKNKWLTSPMQAMIQLIKESNKSRKT